MEMWKAEVNTIVRRRDFMKEKYRDFFSKVVDTSGKVVSLEEYGASSLKSFMDVLNSQALLTGIGYGKRVDEAYRSSGIDFHEIDKIEKYMKAMGKDKYKIILSKRAKRYIEDIRKIGEDIRKIGEDIEFDVNMLFLLAPHTFCQPRSRLSDSTLSDIVNGFCSNSSLNGENGGWKTVGPMRVFNGGSPSISITGYLGTKNPRFKVKVVTKNSLDNKVDKLDVEALFHGRNYQGIVHYHVEKSYTAGALIGANVLDNIYTKLKSIEISRSPDNQAEIIKTGGRKIILYDDIIGKTFVPGTFGFWKDNPDVVGGIITKQIIDAVSTDPRMDVMQLKAASRRK